MEVSSIKIQTIELKSRKAVIHTYIFIDIYRYIDHFHKMYHNKYTERSVGEKYY